jgi:hypothetical protein
MSILIFALHATGPWIPGFPYICYIIGDAIEGGLLVLTFIYLMNQMKNHFIKVYNKNKCSMILFFALEMHVYFYWYVLSYILNSINTGD